MKLYAAVNDVNQFVEAIDNLDVSTDILNDQILNILRKFLATIAMPCRAFRGFI